MSSIQAHAGVRTEGFPSNEDLRHYQLMSDPKLSPEGKRALVQINDSTAEGGRTHLWLVGVDGSKPRQLTYSRSGDGGESQGQWMPDGRSILFLARRGAQTELFRLPMDGGEAKAIHTPKPPAESASAVQEVEVPEVDAQSPDYPPAESDIDVVSYRISPDGQWIALAARDTETQKERRQRESKRDALWVDHDPHDTQLYLLDSKTSKMTAVAVPPDVKDFAWSEDASRLIVLCDVHNDVASLGPSRSTWLVSLADLPQPEQIAEIPATVESVIWSVDGRSLIFKAQAKHDAPPYYSDLYIYSLAEKATRNLSDGFGGSIRFGQPPIALADGGVTQLVEQGTDVAIAVWRHATSMPMLLHSPLSVVSEVATNASRKGWLFLASSGSHPPELFYAAQLTAPPTKLGTPLLTPIGVKSATVQRIHWTNEGWTIDGLLYLDPQALGKGSVPLIVDVHGGPTSAYVDRYDPFVDFLVSRGWAVLRANPRGSTGRGAAFVAANKSDLGGGDYRDIMAGVDYVLKTTATDPARLALIGYSYGGQMAAFAEGKTARFKAIVSGAPVIDQFSEYGTQTSYFSSYDQWFFGRPWERVADAWRQSPLSSVAAAKTPLLLLQGQNDLVDPPGQSYEMYRALRQVGVPVDLVTYPREEHGPLGASIYGGAVDEPWHGFDARQRMVAFIEQAFRTSQTN